MELRRTPVFESSIAQLSRVHCAAPRSHAGHEEHNVELGFIFPSRGVFMWHVGTRKTLADANTAVLLARDTTYRIAHPADGGDECLTLRFSDAVMDEAMREVRACVKPIVLSPARQRALHRLLFALESARDPLAQDEVALALLREMSGATFDAHASCGARKMV